MPWSAIANLLGAHVSSKAEKKMAAKERDLQREFAQHGLSWKVADAEAAGVHPLYALGAATQGYKPLSVGTAGTMGRGIQQAGQSFQRGVDKMMQRRLSDQQELQLEGQRLDNDYKLLRNIAANKDLNQTTRALSEVDARWNQPGQAQGVTDGSGVIVKPTEVLGSDQPGMARGAAPAEMWTIIKNVKHGAIYVPTLTKDLTEQMEENLAFKIPYYSSKLSDYYQGWKATIGGKGSKAGKRWVKFWNRYLPKAKQGQMWRYSTAGHFFYESPITKADTAPYRKFEYQSGAP